MTPQEKLAQILRTKPEVILDMERKMELITGKKNVIEKIIDENERRISRSLAFLDCYNCKAEDIFKFLIKKIQHDDKILCDLFKKPDGISNKGLKTLFDFAIKLANIKPLFVLKKEKAEEILRKNPPPNIIKALKYKGVDELLKKEDLIEIFCALRFVESNKWMHKTFDKTYKNLNPKDFEKRKPDIRVLSIKWLKIAESFIEKKYHNISHLKELGVIFIIPLKIDAPGETLRLFSLILHYSHELDFYSKLFERVAKMVPLNDKAKFGKKLISLLKGEVLKKLPRAKSRGINWMIIQQYLAKHDENDSRLFIPHVNPEAIHWKKAEEDIAKLGEKYKHIDLEFWMELDWVGNFFGEKDNGDKLISFDLVDLTMSLIKNHEQVKYLYHHQEALWNKIFREYMGNENLEKLMIENFNKGYISLSG